MQLRHLPRLANVFLAAPDRLAPRPSLWSRPTRIELDVNNYCNLRCPQCLRQSPRARINQNRLGVADLAKVAPWFRYALSVRLGGSGEPFIQKDIFDIIELILRHGAAPSIVSNCTLIDGAAAERLCGDRPLLLNMSIDAATPEVFEKVRLGAKFDEVVANIDRLAAVKRRKGCMFPILNINMTLMRDTLGEAEGVLELARRWSVPVLTAQQVMFFDKEADRSQAVTNDEAQAALERIAGRAREAGVEIRYVPLASDFESLARREQEGRPVASRHPYHDHARTAGGSRRFYCPYIWQHLWIDWMGNATPCCMADFGIVGNVRESPPAALWNHPRMVSLRGRLASGDPPKECLRCCMLEQHSRGKALRAWRAELRSLRQMLRGSPRKARGESGKV